MRWAVVSGGACAAILAAVRWLRVSQREHYLAGAATRFALRWWGCGWRNLLLGLVASVAVVLSAFSAAAGLVGALLTAVFPLGLGLRGRTAPLRWTSRLRRLAGATAALYVVIVLAASLWEASHIAAIVGAWAMPVLIDAAAAIMRPVELKLSHRYVARAAERLRRFAPTVVAVTGSYGKTTTKGYIRHLLSSRFSVLASPASFNNALGLARTVNEQLDAGVNIFIAEMGTYGEGEIADLTGWIRPKVSVITALGPVHLERFGSIEAIARAKAEIVDGADVVVINADEPLIEMAVRRASPEVRLIRCSERDSGADVYVKTDDDGSVLFLGGDPLGSLEQDAFPMNAACAVGVAVALGVPARTLVQPLSTLPATESRRRAGTAPNGVVVIDDTYNSNPRGAEAAVHLLARSGAIGVRRAVVTPGMVELGNRQHVENVMFAKKAAAIATDMIIVGQTNRRALLEGAGDDAAVTLVGSTEGGVNWVRANLRAGDAVLYENDLPDHYP